MKNRLYCNLSQPASPSETLLRSLRCFVVCVLGIVSPAGAASNAPQWMQSLANVSLPPHDDKADAVLLYSETNVNVISTDKIKTTVREAYKILRPDGREHGTVLVFVNSNRKVTHIRGWCLPVQGKDYEVKESDSVEISPPKIEDAELITDVRAKLLQIPAPEVGNIVGYEYETEERPLVLQDSWDFQGSDPVRESHYSLQLPPGWEYKESWLNHPVVTATQSGGQVRWTVSDISGIRKEEDMPPVSSVLGHMIVAFLPPGGPGNKGYSNWQQMGAWYRTLTDGRLDASLEIRQKVVMLTASASTPLEKMRTLAQFVQHEIRYVAIELGIGGWQPHAAPEIFSHKYGDCKDKATLMSTMLREIGVDSYYVIINQERGAIGPDTPANNGFDHVVLAIKLPDSLTDPAVVATIQHPKLGKLLFFDPTSELTPFGQIAGYLQANWGLLVGPDGGELVELPQQPATMNGIRRVAHFSLDANGRLIGEVQEIRLGDQAASLRWALRTVTKNADRIKPVESVLAGSLSNFQITKASLLDVQRINEPLGLNYTFSAEAYGKAAGRLLLVRPRVIGSKTSRILETKEPRQFPIEFDGTFKDIDRFEIAIPPGYELDDLPPPPVDADFSFGKYQSKTEITGNVIGYTRTLEIKELSVPARKAGELKTFYRTIAADERNTAVLKTAK